MTGGDVFNRPKWPDSSARASLSVRNGSPPCVQVAIGLPRIFNSVEPVCGHPLRTHHYLHSFNSRLSRRDGAFLISNTLRCDAMA